MASVSTCSPWNSNCFDLAMNIDDYNEEDKILGIEKIWDISPYQKAVIKEEARRKFQMMQK